MSIWETASFPVIYAPGSLTIFIPLLKQIFVMGFYEFHIGLPLNAVSVTAHVHDKRFSIMLLRGSCHRDLSVISIFRDKYVVFPDQSRA